MCNLQEMTFGKVITYLKQRFNLNEENMYLLDTKSGKPKIRAPCLFGASCLFLHVIISFDLQTKSLRSVISFEMFSPLERVFLVHSWL